MYIYDKLFSEYNHVVAQILLTASDIENDQRRVNFENTMSRLLELGALPIINENDTVGTEEIAFGDNDSLGAIVACAIQADLLVLMSDIDGLYTADPHRDPTAKLISCVEKIDASIEALAGEKGSELATGGMQTKLRAAKMTVSHGIDMVITNGQQPENLYGIVSGESIGTRFAAKKEG